MRLELTSMFMQLPVVNVTKYGGNLPYMLPLHYDIEKLGFYRPDAGFFDHDPLWYGTYITFDAQLNIPASQYVVNLSPTERMTVKWSQMLAVPAYDPNIGR